MRFFYLKKKCFDIFIANNTSRGIEIIYLLIWKKGGEHRAKYGDSLIKEYSKRLTHELGKGYSTSSLKYMRTFYLFQKGQPSVAQISWSHYVILLSIKDINKINYYINQIIERKLSKRKLFIIKQ